MNGGIFMYQANRECFKFIIKPKRMARLKIFFACYGVLLMAAVLFVYVNIAEAGSGVSWIWPLFIGIKLIMIALNDTRYLYKISDADDIVRVTYYNNWMLKKIKEFKIGDVEITCIRESNWWYGWPHRVAIKTVEKMLVFEVYSKKTFNEAETLRGV